MSNQVSLHESRRLPFAVLSHSAKTLKGPLCRTLRLRNPASISIAALLDRPYRRLVDDLPVGYVGFTVPDELFVGYGFDLEEQYRNLPDLHIRAA